MDNNYTWGLPTKASPTITVLHLGKPVGEANTVTEAQQIEAEHKANRSNEAHNLLGKQRQQVRSRNTNQRRRF